MTRDAEQVARDHMSAVMSGDPLAMAADYAVDAVLERAGSVYEGREEIEAYFASVPSRLGAAKVVFDSLKIVGGTATFRWHLEGSEMPASGTDTCEVSNGLITTQTVRLDASDF